MRNAGAGSWPSSAVKVGPPEMDDPHRASNIAKPAGVPAIPARLSTAKPANGTAT